jgi:hypothetical protein
MRRLAILYDKFLSLEFIQNFTDMFQVKYLDKIKYALKEVIENSRTQAGLYQATVINACDIASYYFNVNEQPTVSIEIDRLKICFKEMWRTNFKSEVEDSKRTRSRQVRDPENLLKEEDITVVVELCSETINKIKTKTKAKSNFCKLRRSLYVLLTVDNSRRGGEVARITIEEVKRYFNTNWTRGNIEDPDKITYVTGKNSSTLVAVCVDKNLLTTLDLLMDTEVRNKSGVKPVNRYVFTSLRSNDPVSGPSEIRLMCRDAGLQETVTSTLIRHYVATELPARFDLTGEESKSLYEIQGHSKEIDEEHYQVPKAALEMRVTRKIRQMVRPSTLSIDHSNLTMSNKKEETQTTKRKLFIEKPLKRKKQSEEKSTSEDDNSELYENESCDDSSCNDSPAKRIYRRWNCEDTEKIKIDFNQLITKQNCPRPTRAGIRTYIKNNKIIFLQQFKQESEIINQLIRKLNNEKKKFSERENKIENSFLSGN